MRRKDTGDPEAIPMPFFHATSFRYAEG